jgi:LysR family hydrogen peroxide-inducible transcriptional activator
MINLPSLRQLQYLIALHQHQHFGKAAQACFVSQSTLSAAIQQLEENLHCQLLERSHKSFIFTTLGEQVVIDAGVIVQSGADLLQYTRRQSEPMAGRLVLGCIPTIAPFVLSPITLATLRQYPDLQLMLKEDTSDNLLSSLAQGQVDMAILALPYDTAGFRQRILAEDGFNLVIHLNLAQQYPGCETGDVSELPNQSLFLLQKEHCLSEQTQSLCQLTNPATINPFLATSLQTLVQMVNAHQGATYLPQMAINNQILSGTGLVSKVASPTTAHRKIALLWRHSSHGYETHECLAELIEAVVIEQCQKAMPIKQRQKEN